MSKLNVLTGVASSLTEDQAARAIINHDLRGRVRTNNTARIQNNNNHNGTFRMKLNGTTTVDLAIFTKKK